MREAVTMALLLSWLSASATAQETKPAQRRLRVEDLLVGHRIEAKVVRSEGTGLRSSDLELLPSGGRDSVTGPVEEVSGERFSVFGVGIEIVPETEGERGVRFDRDSLREGEWVKVDGRMRESGRLRARRIRPEQARDRGTLEGRIETIESTPEGRRLRMLGVDVDVSARERVDVPEELAEASLEALTEEPPSRRRRTEEDFVPGSIRLGEWGTLGGTITGKVDREGEFDLDSSKADTQRTETLRVRLEATVRPSDRVFVVAGVEQEREWVTELGDADETRRRTNLKETFVFVRDLPARGLDLEAGRIHLKDDRQWLYDRDLDGVRLSYDRPQWHAETSLTTVWFGGRATRTRFVPRPPGIPTKQIAETSGERDEEATNVTATLTREFPERDEVSGFFVGRFDRGREDDSPLFVGIQARLKSVEDLEAWADVAGVWGTDRDERIRGYGFDVGATLELPLPLKPSLTASYAFGSGGDDDPTDGDSNFRQTGFQDNVDRWSGITSFNYYGEVLDPELSNLSVATAGLGFRLGRRTSLDLVAHRYTQPRPAPFLRDMNPDGDLLPVSQRVADPDGVHHEIGWEGDAILGWREIRNLDVEVVYGRFEPGEALSLAEPAATFLKFEVRFKF
ncbi:MAG TPA: alginate export family protein [Planctomycetota bacterium]|nr:alginate export family protein [Planctomycetota bacterium]